ncbi:MAG TPA: tail protein X [Candidatus Coproplasma excrementipullorum]|nr:tail protein X [Candidatus Coproplasma excrementipullorum]
MTVLRYIEYVTRLGDTFDELALQFYDEEKMASYIIAANPDYADVLIFEDTVTLRIPIFDDSSKPATLAPWRRNS